MASWATGTESNREGKERYVEGTPPPRRSQRLLLCPCLCRYNSLFDGGIRLHHYRASYMLCAGLLLLGARCGISASIHLYLLDITRQRRKAMDKVRYNHSCLHVFCAAHTDWVPGDQTGSNRHLSNDTAYRWPGAIPYLHSTETFSSGASLAGRGFSSS